MVSVFTFLIALSWKSHAYIELGNDHKRIVDLPTGCLKRQSFPCAISALKKSVIKLDSAKLVLEKNSEIYFDENKHVSILRGDVFTISGEFWISYGTVLLKTRDDVWIGLRKDEIRYRVWDGEVKVFSSGKEIDFTMSGGENWIQGINPKNGQLVKGITRPFDFKEAIRFWVPGTLLSYQDRINRIQKFHENWLTIKRESSDVYSAAANRSIASLEEQSKKQEQEAFRKKKEKQDMKNLILRRGQGN